MSKRITIDTAIVVQRAEYCLVVARSTHKQPRLYVHKRKHTPVGAQQIRNLASDVAMITPAHWMQIDAAELAMSGSVRAI